MKNLSITISIFLLSIIISNTNAQNPTWNWTNNFGGYTDNNYMQDAAVDADGNFFIAGFFAFELEIGTEFFNAQADIFDLFFAKFDADNNFQWAKAYGTSQQNYANRIATDTNGDVYVAGQFSGTIDLGNDVELTSLESDSDWDAYIAKFDGTDGTAIWAVSMGNSTDWDFGNAMYVDNLGNVYIDGGFEGTANFGGTDITASNGNDAFIAKYDTDGTFQWVEQISGTDEQTVIGITCDDTYLYLAGAYAIEAILDATTITADDGADGFYAKYDLDGNFQSVAHIGGTGSEISLDIAVDANGNVALTGYFTTQIDFNGTPTSVTAQSGFVAYYDNTDTYQWNNIIESTTKKNSTSNLTINQYPTNTNIKDAKSETSNTSKKVAFDSEGSVFAAGGYVDIVDFGLGNEHDALNFTDIFLVKYDNTGTTQFVETSTSSDDSWGDFCNGLAIYNGSVYVAGDFENTITFAGESMTCPDDAEHFFIAKTISENASSENDILAFSFIEQTGDAIINNTNHTIEIEVTEGTDLTALIPTITISDFATIDPLTGVEQDFSATFKYTVTAENSDEQIWLVTVTRVPFSGNDILTFDFAGVEEISVNIDDVNFTVDIEVPNGTNLTTLTPSITISEGATISPESGIYQDLTDPVIYTVTAENSNEQEWLVTVTIATGIDNLSANNILIYPNPSNGIFTIQNFSNSQIHNLIITDITGKIIFSKDVACNVSTTKINLTTGHAQLHKGIYFININTETDIYTEKIIIK